MLSDHAELRGGEVKPHSLGPQNPRSRTIWSSLMARRSVIIIRANNGKTSSGAYIMIKDVGRLAAASMGTNIMQISRSVTQLQVKRTNPTRGNTNNTRATVATNRTMTCGTKTIGTIQSGATPKVNTARLTMNTQRGTTTIGKLIQDEHEDQDKNQDKLQY